MGRLTKLAGTWRQHADTLRQYGDDRGGAVLEALADQLEQAIREHQNEVLTLAEAAQESGYSKRRLRELMAEGKLENQGEKGRPRILRRDLPVKPARNGRGTHPVTSNGSGKRVGTQSHAYDPLQDARALVGRMAAG